MGRDPRAALSPTQRFVTQPLAYAALRTALTPTHVFPLPTVLAGARKLGRAFGGAKFNTKRVTKAAERLDVAMPGLSADERHELVLKSYEHLAMLGAELSIVPRLLSEDAWTEYVQLGDMEHALRLIVSERPTLLLTAHAGNWEVIGYTMALLGFETHAIYRPLDLRPADEWVRQTRSRRGLSLLDKFGAMREMPALMRDGRAVAFVADQNAGERGLQVPFMGRLASSYKSIGLTALQFNANIVLGVARREPVPPGSYAPMKYRIEVADAIRPEDWADAPDPLFYITARYRRSIEQMIRKAPEQYLWMHRIWKSRPRHERLDKPFPPALREKLATLPWMTDDELERIVDRSERDRRYLAEHNLTRLS